MDVAKYVGNAFGRKLNGLRRTGFVEPKVKTLPVEKRKDIVKERVSIGKLNDGTNGNDQKVRKEFAVLLQKGVGPLRREGKSRCS
jgi:hypothetical protein